MNDRKKMLKDIRRSVGSAYHFQQNSYINFKSENGYFFCLYFLPQEVRLTAKPMYADDLWWDIWDASENKECPMSLRGVGAFSLPGQILATYAGPEATSEAELTEEISAIFKDAAEVIAAFLVANPDADTFYPDESKMDEDPDRLLHIIALIHNGREAEVLQIIDEARVSGHECRFRSGRRRDCYTYIRQWCTCGSKSGKIRRRLMQLTDNMVKSDNKRKGYKDRGPRLRHHRSWRELCLLILIFLIPGIVVIVAMRYFFSIHRVTLYPKSWLIWLFAGTLFSILLAPLSLLKKSEKKRSLKSMIIVFAVVGFLTTPLTSFLAIGLFDSVNYWFAEKELVFVNAVVTDEKDIHIGSWRTRHLTHYITKVIVPEENRSLKIDDLFLVSVPAGKEITLIYRRGFLGVSIFENFAYPPLDESYDHLIYHKTD